MKHASIVIACLMCLFWIGAAKGAGDSPPLHWPTDLWPSGVQTDNEVNVMFNFTDIVPVPDLVPDHTTGGAPLVPGWRMTDPTTGLSIVIYRKGGDALDVVSINVFEYGQCLSPFGAQDRATPLVLEVEPESLENGTYDGWKVARISWEMGDRVNSDEDAFEAYAYSSLTDDEGVHLVNLVFTQDDGGNDLYQNLNIGTGPQGVGRFGSSVRWVQNATGIEQLILIAGALTGDTPNSVYYDNFMLTLQEVGTGDTVGAGTDAPSSEFGGGIGDPVGDDDNGDGGPDDELIESPGVEWVQPYALEGLIDAVEVLGLDKGTANSLVSKIKDAQDKVDEGKLTSALGKLEAFINGVEAQYGKKIDEEDADFLIEYAEALIDIITEES